MACGDLMGCGCPRGCCDATGSGDPPQAASIPRAAGAPQLQRWGSAIPWVAAACVSMSCGEAIGSGPIAVVMEFRDSMCRSHMSCGDAMCHSAFMGRSEPMGCGDPMGDDDPMGKAPNRASPRSSNRTGRQDQRESDQRPGRSRHVSYAFRVLSGFRRRCHEADRRRRKRRRCLLQRRGVRESREAGPFL